MKTFEYSRGEALDTVAEGLGPDVRMLAGGTDLVPLLRDRIVSCDRLVDIKTTDLPSDIRETARGISIGALVTLSDMAAHPLIREQYPLLREALLETATPQIRNRATVGGNLVQRPRCWYYRHPDLDCWLKGGEHCPARDGENRYHAVIDTGPCVAVHPSDLAGCLVALDATVRVRRGDNERVVPLQDFLCAPEDDWRQTTVLRENEVIVSVDLPPLEIAASTYLKAMDRKAWAFALVGVAAVLVKRPESRRELRLTINGVAAFPWRIHPITIGDEEEDTDAVIAHAHRFFRAHARALGHNRYKLALAEGLLAEAVERVLDAG